LLLHFLHHLLPGTLWADDILPILDEALAHHGVLADVAEEALVVPGQGLEGYKLCASKPPLSRDGFTASSAAFGEEFAKAVSAVRLVITRREPLPCQRLLAVRAGEALPMPGVITVGNPSLGYDLAALDALGGKFLLIALGTVDIVLLGDEGLGAYGVFTCAAHEALLVPLSGLVLHLLHSCFENISAPVTPGGELCVIAWSTVDSVSLGAELLVHEAGPALVAEEAGLMPVLLFIRQVLRVNTNDFSTFIAIVCKYIFITLYAVGMVVSQDIPVTCKAVVAVMAKHCFYFWFLARLVLRLPEIRNNLRNYSCVVS